MRNLIDIRISERNAHVNNFAKYVFSFITSKYTIYLYDEHSKRRDFLFLIQNIRHNIKQNFIDLENKKK